MSDEDPFEFVLHHHHHNSACPGTQDVLSAIQAMEDKLMSALSDAVATLVADDNTLAQEVDSLISALAELPKEVAAGVQEALDKAGTDDETARVAVVAVDGVVRNASARAIAALTPVVPPGVVVEPPPPPEAAPAEVPPEPAPEAPTAT